jgi:hypothetical protein
MENSDDLSKFLKLVNATIVQVADHGVCQARNALNEIEILWEQCEKECRKIQFILLNFESENNENLASKLDNTIELLSSGNYKPSIAVFLRYLTLSDTLK